MAQNCDEAADCQCRKRAPPQSFFQEFLELHVDYGTLCHIYFTYGTRVPPTSQRAITMKSVILSVVLASTSFWHSRQTTHP